MTRTPWKRNEGKPAASRYWPAVWACLTTLIIVWAPIAWRMALVEGCHATATWSTICRWGR